MKHNVLLRRAEVFDFVTTASSYTIHVEPNLRLDVARCKSIELVRELEVPHWGYLWVQAVQGFFVFRQAILGGVPGAWQMIYEIEPAEFSSSFFAWAEENFGSLIRDWNERSGEVAVPPLGNDPEGSLSSEGEGSEGATSSERPQMGE